MNKSSHKRPKTSGIPALFSFKAAIPIILLLAPLLGAGYAMAEVGREISKNIVIKDKTSLFHLMLAEIAGKREYTKLAIHHYFHAAEKSREPALAELTTEYAIQIQDIELARRAASLWADISPNTFRPLLVAATLHIAIDNKKTKAYLIKALELDSQSFYNEVTSNYPILSRVSQIQLSDLLLELSTIPKYGNNPYLLLTTAYLTAQQDLISIAEKLTDQALAIKQSLSEAIELKAKIIRFRQQSDKPALQYIAKKIKQFPKDNRLRFFYASALIDNNEIEKAIVNLKQITKDKEYSSKAAITLGRLYLDNKQFKLAKTEFKKLKEYPEYWSSGKYFLAQIAERQNKLADATEWYRKVYDGPFHISSFIRAALLLSIDNKYSEAVNLLDNAQPTNLAAHKKIILTKVEILIDSGKYEQALNDVNNALDIIPTDIDLLYARSLIAGYLDNIALAEQDLNKILSLDPNHANALNAMGFTLSNIPERRQDAMTYIERAMKISPGNPNYMDSMGWLLYQMGKIDEAVTLLGKAYELSKDIDIAIHYSQALWAKGNKKQAMSILNQALQLDPNNKALKEALNGFESGFESK